MDARDTAKLKNKIKNKMNILESIIKVEPEEFPARTVDDILRFKAKM